MPFIFIKTLGFEQFSERIVIEVNVLIVQI